MFRSATFKLTVWYLMIIVAISIMFSLVVYHLAVNELASGLSHQSARFSDEFPAFSNNPQVRMRGELASGRQEIVSNLLIFNVLVFVTAGFGSYALARRTLEPIEQAHEQQKRFTADVSHELRTPLTALKMETEVALLDTSLSKQQLRDALKSNLEEAGKLELLTNNLLKLTRLELDEIQETFTTVPLDTVVTAAIEQITPMSQTKSITIDMAKNRQVAVRGDAATLTQLFVILLDNAIKYSPSGKTVEVSVALMERSAVATITDHGAGIEKTALEHVFERFYRANKARTSSTTDGYGLGLSIAKHIADMHEGTITLSSRVGHGTTAVVRFPKASDVS